MQAEIYLFRDLTNLVPRCNFVFLCWERFRFLVRAAIPFFCAESDLFRFPIPNSISDFQFLIPFPFPFPLPFPVPVPLPFPVPVPLPLRRRSRSAAWRFGRGVNAHCKRERRRALTGAGARLMALTVNDQQNNARFCEKSANNAKIMFEFGIMVGALRKIAGLSMPRKF